MKKTTLACLLIVLTSFEIGLSIYRIKQAEIVKLSYDLNTETIKINTAATEKQNILMQSVCNKIDSTKDASIRIRKLLEKDLGPNDVVIPW